MQEIQNSNKSNSYNSSESKDRASREFNELQKDGYRHPFRIIQAANRKLRLYSVLKNYNINIPKNSRKQVWSNTITCPLPSHKGSNERTPSFGYNFVADRFNCLGCKKSGRAVEFISEMEGRKRTAVAESILDHYSDSDYLDEPVEQEDPRVENLLFSMSKFIRDSLKSCVDKNKVKEIDKVIWWFDSYISVRVGAKNGYTEQNIDVEEMEARIIKAKELIEEIIK